MDDARVAVETGVDGVDVVIGTSSFLRQYSHGKDMTYILKTAIEVIEFVKSKGIEIRFSSEDSFRSDLVDLLSIYQAVDKVGVNRVGIADTVGCANPRQVYDLVRTLRGVVGCDIETCVDMLLLLPLPGLSLPLLLMLSMRIAHYAGTSTTTPAAPSATPSARSRPARRTWTPAYLGLERGTESLLSVASSRA